MSEEMLKSLLNKMTLDEKIAQLIQLASHFYEGSNAKGDSYWSNS